MPLWKDPKTGKWRYQFQHRGRRFSKTGFKTKAEARNAQEAYRKSLTNPETPQSPLMPSASDYGTLSLEELMVRYLRVAQRSLAPITLRYRKTVFRRFLKHIGNFPVASITT
jgi:hypothetical protein